MVALVVHRGNASNPCYSDRAHLHPDGARCHRSQHALVAGDPNDGIGVGHHGDNDGGLPGGTDSGVRDLRTELG